MAYKGPMSDSISAYVCFTLSLARFRSLAYLKNSLRKNTIQFFSFSLRNEGKITYTEKIEIVHDLRHIWKLNEICK